ncbi:MAG: hypothetical protein PHC88_00815 [Terrimicrobiaceae bacterium]|nr:hypothetical protein [Terrimicrobiaceae bacterium]
MRIPLLLAAVSFLTPLAAHAGRLDIAVMQFTDPRDPTAMAQALNGVDLAQITDSDRTETNVPALRGGYVVFTQTLAVSPGGKFASTTRLTNQRADVSGSLNGSRLSVSIRILEGVKIGLRKFRESLYTGSASVAGGVPQLISVAQRIGKTQTAIKGRATIVSYNYTTIIAARYTP